MQRMRVALTAIGLMALGAACGCGGMRERFAVSGARSIEWLLAIDATDSVPPAAFEKYKVELARDSVLCRLWPGETVHVLAMDSDPIDDAESFTVEPGSPTDILKRELAIYQHIKDMKRRPPTERGTNLSAVINHLAEKIAYAEEVRQKRARGGETPPALPTYVVVVLTDGVVEGWQVEGIGGLPKDVDVRIWFCGISPWSENDPQAKKLRALLSKDYPNLKDRPLKDLVERSLRDACRGWGLGQVNVRPYAHSDWVKDFLADLNRQQNLSTLKGLETGRLPEEGY